MKRPIWMLLVPLLLVLLIASCGETPTPTPTPTPQPTNTPVPTKPPLPTDTPKPTPPAVVLGDEERSKEGGFAYRPIPGYEVTAFGPGVMMISPDGDADTGPLVYLFSEPDEEGITLDEAFEFFVADISEEDIQLGEVVDITVGGQPGKSVDISGAPEGQEMAGRIVVVVPDVPILFASIGFAPADRWEGEVAPVFESVLKSLSFFKPEPAVEPTVPPVPTQAGGLSEIRQWASSANASSEYGSTDWAASQATGAPDTLNCGDYTTAWASASTDGEEWLELGYDTPVIPAEVNILQSYNPSQVVLVELLDTAGAYHEIYSGQPQDMAECPYTLSISIARADYQAVGVRITIDQSALQDWNEIDAVELVGLAEKTAGPVETPPPLPVAGPTVTPVPKPVVELEPGWTIYSNANYVNGLAFHEGRLWAATGGGVVAWNPDGSAATKYTTLDGLPHNEVNAIISCPVPDPRVIAGTDQGLAILNPDTDRWELLKPGDNAYVGDSRISSLGCGYDSRILLIGYGAYGMHMWDSQADEWFHVSKSESGLGSDTVAAIGIVGDMEEIWAAGSRTVSRITGDGITVYTEDDDPMLDAYITHIVADAAGNVWMGQFIGEELIHFYDGTWTAYGPDNVDTYPFLGGAQGLEIGPDGSIWIVSSFGNVCQFDPLSESCLATYEDQPGQVGFPVHSLALDPQGNVYYGSNGEGISAFNGSSWTELVLDEPLVSNNLQGLGLDHYGNLWIGTSVDGIQVLDPTDVEAAWAHYTDLPSYSINTFYANPWGGLWIGHSAGASFYDGANWTHFEQENGILDDVDSIAADAQGRIWFGTSEGISIWDGQSFDTLDEEDNLPGSYARAMVFDGQTTWVGIWGQGLFGFGTFDVSIYDETTGLPSNNVAALALDLDGSLLVGADDSIVRMDRNGEFTVLYKAESWSALITSIAVAPNGDIWASDLFDGVYHFDGSTWEHLTTADGLPTNQYYEGTVAIDHLGTVWFAGLDGGLARYVP